jgi:hypothetical protein
MATILNVRKQLERLRDSLDGGCSSHGWFETEQSEDVAEVISLMAEVGSTLVQEVANFMTEWDFAEDCRRSREKEAKAPAEVTP